MKPLYIADDADDDQLEKWNRFIFPEYFPTPFVYSKYNRQILMHEQYQFSSFSIDNLIELIFSNDDCHNKEICLTFKAG